MRAIVDRDITPTDALYDGLPDDWEVSVGVEGTVAGAAAAVRDADVALVTSRVPVSREVIDAADRLRVVGKLGTGVDNVDLAAAAERGLPVTHTPGHNALSVAEHAICLVLATARRLTEARELLTSGRWRDEYALSTRLSGSTVGIVGLGNVGTRVGRLLAGFDVDVLVTDPYVPDADAELVCGSTASFERLTAESDVVVLATELTAETRGLVGAAELSRMKESAILVNVARGPVVDEAALAEAVESGAIAGAGVDVFADEPPDPDGPLLSSDRIVATPHVAATTVESRREGIDLLTTNVRRLLAGEGVADRFLATPE